jgi:hypothetical protein
VSKKPSKAATSTFKLHYSLTVHAELKEMAFQQCPGKVDATEQKSFQLIFGIDVAFSKKIKDKITSARKQEYQL